MRSFTKRGSASATRGSAGATPRPVGAPLPVAPPRHVVTPSPVEAPLPVAAPCPVAPPLRRVAATPRSRAATRRGSGAMGVLGFAPALLAFAFLGACSREQTAPPPPAAAAPGFPRRVSLPDGTALELQAPPQRVVPASATAVDIAAALLAPERIAGIPEQALEYSTLNTIDTPNARSDAAAWKSVARFDAYLAEPVLRLLPDLVLIDPWQSKDTSERLRAAGVTLCVLPEIKSWPDARGALELAGRAFGEEERASALIADLDARVERLRQNPGRRAGLRAVTYSNFGSAGWSAGLSTTIHEEMTLAGLTNAVADKGREGHVPLSFEELLVLDPDLILVSRPLKMAPGSAGDRGGASERLLYSEPSLRSLRAIREKRVVSLPAWLYATGSHEIVSGAERLAHEVDALLAQAEPDAGGGRAR